VIVVILLLVWISISTYRNLNRDREKALGFVQRQGLTLVHALESGVRAGLMIPFWSEESIARIIEETGKNEDIAYIYLFDKNGKVVHHSLPSIQSTTTTWTPRLTDESSIETRLRNLPDGSQIYDLAKQFLPLTFLERITRSDDLLKTYPGLKNYKMKKAIIVLGMNMKTFEAARRADFNHAMIMAAIVVALGSGAFFFIFVIQNYYLVDRTLKETQDYTRQVVENMANGLLSIDLHGRVVSYNDLALELLGLEERSIRDTNLSDVIDFHTAGINDTLIQSRPALEREVICRKKTGPPIPLSVSSTPLFSPGGKISGAVVVLRDLREIKRLEDQIRQSEKLAAIGKLAAGVAHEIRNPLSSIRGFAQFLSHSLSDRAEEQEYANVMVKEVDRINGVVSDLLTLSRPLVFEPVPTDINKMVAHAIRLVQDDAESRNIRIREDISPDMGKVSIDANQITQALLNLLLNAIQAIETKGNLIIGASLNDQRDQLSLWVEDDGPGVPLEIGGNIFDPFVTTRADGNGLGLAIVHTIVENHTGGVDYQSPPQGKSQGSRFTINLPVGG